MASIVLIMFVGTGACTHASNSGSGAEARATTPSVPNGFEDAPRILSPTPHPKWVQFREPWVPQRFLRVNTATGAEEFVDETGAVVFTRYLSGDRDFFPEIEAVASKWRFEPLMVNGKPSRFRLPLTFTLTWRDDPLAASIQISQMAQ